MDTSYANPKRFKPVTNVNFNDKYFVEAMDKGTPAIDDYLLALAICHTIITENKDGEIIYNVRNSVKVNNC